MMSHPAVLNLRMDLDQATFSVTIWESIRRKPNGTTISPQEKNMVNPIKMANFKWLGNILENLLKL